MGLVRRGSFEQRLEGSERFSLVDILEKRIPGSESKQYKEQCGGGHG